MTLVEFVATHQNCAINDVPVVMVRSVLEDTGIANPCRHSRLIEFVDDPTSIFVSLRFSDGKFVNFKRSGFYTAPGPYGVEAVTSFFELDQDFDEADEVDLSGLL